jgi:hypothetical protein
MGQAANTVLSGLCLSSNINLILAHKPATRRRFWIEIALALVWKVGIGLEFKAFAHMTSAE